MAKLKTNQFILSGHLITERPILFQTEMVQANLDDRKNQTRRTKGLESINVDADFWNRQNNPKRHISRLWDSSKEVNPNPIEIQYGFTDPLGSKEYIRCPYGKPGDLLWVKETWAYFSGIDPDEIVYKSDGLFDTKAKEHLVGNKWKPSIHMPKSAARIWLMIEDIRVERVQDISEEDAIAEGIDHIDIHGEKVWKRYDGYNTVTSAPLVSFWSLWAAINGEESWQTDPWVWVIKFRVLSKTGRPSDEQILASHLSILDSKKRKEVVNE